MDFLLDALDEIAAAVFARLVDRDPGIVSCTPPRSTGRLPEPRSRKMIAIHPAAYGSFGSS
jgi:hypothetical protein